MASFKQCFLPPTDMHFQSRSSGAEYEPIPQDRPRPTPIPDSTRCQTHRIVRGCYMEPPRSLPASSWDPKIRKIMSSKMWSEWSVNKNNGLQDETPKWFIHGCPNRRPGPAYVNVVAYYPTCPCNNCPRTTVGPIHWPKAFMIEGCLPVARSKKEVIPFCPRP